MVMDRAQSRGRETTAAASGALLPSALAETLRREAEAAWPRECCGLLLGAPSTHESVTLASVPRIVRTVPASNVATDPLRHFEIDPAVLIAAHRAARHGGPRVLGYYHSHPSGIAAPSATDKAQAAGDGSIWAIIACAAAPGAGGSATAGDIRLWADRPDGFVALSSPRAEG